MLTERTIKKELNIIQIMMKIREGDQAELRAIQQTLCWIIDNRKTMRPSKYAKL